MQNCRFVSESTKIKIDQHGERIPYFRKAYQCQSRSHLKNEPVYS